MTDPLSVSASIAGLVTLADIVFGRTYKYVKACKKAPKEISALSAEIGALYGILSNLYLVCRQIEHEQAESTTRIHHIHSCYQTLDQVKSILDRDDTSLLRDERLETLKKKLRWPFTSSEVKGLVADIERHKTTLGLALNVDCMSHLLQALSKHDEICNSIEGMRTELEERHEAETRIAINKKKQDILNSFAKVDPRSNHDMSRRLRSPATGLWLTEGQEFKQWSTTKNARLWLYGIPGAGKTVLAWSVIEEALRKASPSTAVAFFYCDYKNADSQELSNVLGSLAQQFAKQDEQSFAKLRDFYETRNPEHQVDYKYDPEALLDLVRAVTSVFDCAMIIVDGLDECGKNTPLVVDSLIALNDNEDATVKMILLSRDEIDIRERLQNFAKLSIAAKTSDLKLYVGAEIDLRTRKKRLRIKDESLKEHILERLVKGAEGMFRWVTCQMDYLCELPNDAARRKALDSLPPDLNSTYERILDRVNQSNPETQKLVQRALRWIAHTSTFSGFNSEALCEAVSIDFSSTKQDSEAIPDEFEILHWCSSLVRKSTRGENLELAHFTVMEFLQQIDSSRDVSIAKYRIHYETDRITLGKVCLTYLNFEDFNQSTLPDLRVIERRLRRYPFREYAIRWLSGVNMLHDDMDDNELVSLAQKLWSPSKPDTFISWMYDTSAAVFGDWPGEAEKLGVIKSGFAETTALHWMAMGGSGKMCSWLIKSGCDVNRSSAFGTPLHCALMGWDTYRWSFSEPALQRPSLLIDDGCNDLVHLLLEAGADPNCYYECGSEKLSTMYIALLISNSELVMRLLDEGGILDDRCLDALETEVENEDICDIIDYASEYHVEPETRGRLLQLAVKAERPNATRLIQNGDGAPLESTHCEELLRTAAELGQPEIVRGLLEHQRLDVDAANEDTGMTALHHAAQTDQLEIIEILMDHGADSSRSDSQGRNALHHSLQGREVRSLGFFLHRDADTSLLDMQGMSPWHLAAQNGNVQALSILLGRPEDSASAIDLKTKDGRTPLLCASASNSKEAVSLLIDAGSSLTETASDGSSLLHYAVKSGNLEVVKFLVEKAVDPHAVTKDGSTAIHCAVSSHLSGGKTVDIMRLLLEVGVNPCRTRNKDRTPLHDLFDAIKESSSSPDKLDCLFATSQMLLKSSLEKCRTASFMTLGSELVYLACLRVFPSVDDTVSALLDLGLDPNIHFEDGNTALMAAARSGNGAVLSNLIRHGADPCGNDLGVNALIYACFYGNTDIVVRLRETGIDWNSKTKAGILGEQRTEVTALHLAAMNGDSSILEFLLNEGLVLDVNVRTGSGETPLLLAAWAGASRNVSVLLSNNADTTCIDEFGDGAVHVAAEHGHADVISELMRHGSDLKLRNSRGLTPELLARKNGHKTLADNILDYVNKQENGPDDSPRTIDGTSEALKIAIDLGDLELFTRLIESGTDPDTGLECCMGCTPLLYSLQCGEDAIAEYLVSHGASIAGSTCELRSTRGFTVFHYAAVWNAKLLRLLLEKAPSEINLTLDPIHPIHLAIFRGNADCVELILDHASQGTKLSPRENLECGNLDINTGRGRILSDQLGTSQEAVNRLVNLQVRSELLRWSWHGTHKKDFPEKFQSAKPLHIAAYEGHLPIVRMLLAYGASVDGEDTDFLTPLHYAVQNGQASTIKVLLDAGANPNALNSDLESPCMLAAATGQVDSIRILMKSGGDFQLQTRHRETALHLAAEAGAKDALVLLMTEHSLYAENVWGQTVLHKIICQPATFSMSFLLNLAPQAAAYESQRYTILNAATEHRSTIEVKMLFRLVPDGLLPKVLNYRHLDEGTPLHTAAILSRLDTITLFLDLGAQLELEGSDYGTPLMAACATGRLAAVRLLVARGARTSYVENGQLFSAFTAAKNHPRVRRWLLVGRFLEGPRLLM